MDIGSFSNALLIIQGGGYLFLLVAMFLEGPIITTAASFLASQGFFNVYVIFLLSFLGNFLPDILFYWIGRVGRLGFIEKYGGYFGIKKASVKKFSGYFDKNYKKAIVVSKLMPFTGVLGVFSAGMSKIDFKKFLFVDFLFNLVSAAIFTFMGFYFGLAFSRISDHLGWIFSGLGFLVIIFALVPFIYKRLASKLSGKIEKNLNKVK